MSFLSFIYIRERSEEKRRVTQTVSSVGAEFVAIGALARVAPRRVLADADAEIVVFEFRALVDVGAGSIVGVQSESSLASASVTTPQVHAHVLAESRCSLTLVDVLYR